MMEELEISRGEIRRLKARERKITIFKSKHMFSFSEKRNDKDISPWSTYYDYTGRYIIGTTMDLAKTKHSFFSSKKYTMSATEARKATDKKTLENIFHVIGYTSAEGKSNYRIEANTSQFVQNELIRLGFVVGSDSDNPDYILVSW